MSEEKNEKLQNSIEALKKSPTFALSSSSKELSHSNMWAWLFKQDKNYAEIFFKYNNSFKGDIKNIDELDVKREEGNRDITIWCNGNAYVIENKLKSIPNEKQLKEYEEKLGDKFKGGVLAAPQKPNFDIPENWKYVSYKEIYNGINEINNNKNSIITQYTIDLDNIINIINNKCGSAKEKEIIPLNENYTDVECIKMDDICKKLQASRFCEYLQGNENIIIFKTIAKKQGYTLVISSDYSNKQSIVDVKYVNENEKSIGIQIQNKQYRRFVQEFENHSEKETLFKNYKEDWFGEKKEKNLTWDSTSYTTGMKNDYCSYNTKNYCFVYQYITLDDDNCSFGSVADKIRDDMKKALNLLDKNICTE